MSTSQTLASAILCAPRTERREVMAHEFRSGMREETLATDAFLDLSTRPGLVLCLEGVLWLTRYGESEDHILLAGEQFAIRRRDQITVQALRPSRVRVIGN